MKKITLLLPPLFFAFCACNQQPKSELDTKPNADSVAKAAAHFDDSQHAFLDAKGLKQGYWIIKGWGHKPALPGYKPTAKVEEGQYKDDKREGIWIEYNPNGEIKRKVKYANDSIVEVVQEEKK